MIEPTIVVALITAGAGIATGIATLVIKELLTRKNRKENDKQQPEAPPNVMVTFSSIPTAGSGPNSKGEIKGSVSGLPSPQRYAAVIYARTDLWYVQPLVSAPFTEISVEGLWENSTHLGSRYAALIVRRGFDPPPIIGSLPFIEGDVIAKAETAASSVQTHSSNAGTAQLHILKNAKDEITGRFASTVSLLRREHSSALTEAEFKAARGKKLRDLPTFLEEVWKALRHAAQHGEVLNLRAIYDYLGDYVLLCYDSAVMWKGDPRPPDPENWSDFLSFWKAMLEERERQK